MHPYPPSAAPLVIDHPTSSPPGVDLDAVAAMIHNRGRSFFAKPNPSNFFTYLSFPRYLQQPPTRQCKTPRPHPGRRPLGRRRQPPLQAHPHEHGAGAVDPCRRRFSRNHRAAVGAAPPAPPPGTAAAAASATTAAAEGFEHLERRRWRRGGNERSGTVAGGHPRHGARSRPQQTCLQ